MASDSSWFAAVDALMVSLFGPERAPSVMAAVIPGVLGDFRAMLDKAPPDTPVHEDYHIEGANAVLRLTGCKQKKNGRVTLAVTQTAINDQNLNVSLTL